MCVHAFVRVCHRWYDADDSDYCGDQSIAALSHLSSPFFLKAWVGGEGWREEVRKEREKRRLDDGKWPPPQCQMGGGFERVSLKLLLLDAL